MRITDRGENTLESNEVDDWPDIKVARLIKTYELELVVGDRLDDTMTADGDRRESLWSLADRFKRRLLEATMADARMATLDGEVSNIYRLLTEDGVSNRNRTKVRQRLEELSIDVEQLTWDFVT